METSATYELSICTACYLYDQHGLESFEDGGEHIDDDWHDQCSAIIDGFDKLPPTGLMSDRHDDAWWGDKVYFSWSPCDICGFFYDGDRLGGDRYDVVWTTFKTPQAVTLN